MKSKKGLIILVVVLAAVIVAAAVLYNNLAGKNAPDQLVVANAAAENGAAAQTKAEAKAVEPEEEKTEAKEPEDQKTEEAAAEIGTPDREDADNTAASEQENETGGTPKTEMKTTGTPDSENEADSASDQEESETDPAPDFTVYDAEENEVHLSDFRGTPVVLNFWASWCGPCASEMPDLNEAYLNYGDAVQFLMVDLADGYQETPEAAQKFIAQNGYEFPVFFDTTGSAAYAYLVMSIPATYFIDENGVVASHAYGAMTADTLQRGLESIIP